MARRTVGGDRMRASRTPAASVPFPMMVSAAMALRSTDKTLFPPRLRKLIVGTALVIAAIVAANAFILAQLRQSTLRDVQDNLLRQSLAMSELAERTLQATDLVLLGVTEKIQAIAAMPDGASRLEQEDIHTFLKDKIADVPQLHALGILDADGVRLNESRVYPAERNNYSYREYFKALKANPALPSFLSAPIRGVVTGAWVIIIARPLVTADGKFNGAIFASTDTKYFQGLFQATSLGDGYAVALIRDDGTLVTRYPMAGEIGATVPASLLPALEHSRSAVGRSLSPIDHVPRIAAGYRLHDYPLVVVATQTEQAAFAAWRTTALTVSLITAMMIAVIIIAAWQIARSWRQQERLNVARAEIVEADKERVLAEAELTRQRERAEQSMRFNAALENMTHGLCMFDKDKRLVVCNERYSKMYNVPAELAVPGTSLDAILAYRHGKGLLRGGKVAAALERQLNVLSALPPDQKTTRIDEHQDGRLVRVTRQPLPDGGWVATHDDITEQYRAEQELNETKQFLDSIIDNIPIAVVVKDAVTRKFVLVNRAFQTMRGLDRSELVGKTVFEFYNRRTAEFIHNVDSQVLRGDADGHYLEYDVDTVEGTRVYATSRIVVRGIDGEAKYLIVVINDITERKKSEQHIAFMAHHDALTGLANRAAITQRIEEAAARQRRWGDPFTVLLLDLDRFKHVNDTLGHSAGDALLRETAARLKTLLRETDVLARLGGDEFAVIQSGETAQRAAASALAERIIEIVGKTFDIDGNEVNIGTSIGIALAPEHGTNPDSLLKMADMALYSAKSAGRNGYRFFDPGMGAAADARLALDNELRRALQQNELVLYYQPIVETKTGRICGAEALLRWRHPTKGIITPDNFIPLAEDTGMIGQIGVFVLQTACADAVKWPADVKVAVNLSPVQFRRTNLAAVVMDALAKAGLPPSRLELEITETALIESGAECLPALHQFKSAGISVALDDFGTGYSSLSQLTMFPFDKIKIDKSFTQNLTKRAECAAIISATLTLAHGLDIATTAEGVETNEQYKLLRLAGVTSLQGYLFKRPSPVEDIDFDVIYDGPTSVAEVA
jgi:diguanylate cyclase (GGDEF)-like protein/PAS domain S-box-containing protein